jgi:hypothetical protein
MKLVGDVAAGRRVAPLEHGIRPRYECARTMTPDAA